MLPRCLGLSRVIDLFLRLFGDLHPSTKGRLTAPAKNRRRRASQSVFPDERMYTVSDVE